MKITIRPEGAELDPQLSVRGEQAKYEEKNFGEHAEDGLGHLGGHLFKTHVDIGALEYLIEKFGIKSMIDIGCGPGGMLEIAKERGLTVTGIDGDPRVITDDMILWDYNKGPSPFSSEGCNPVDLAWSVEFLEHVEAKYLDNFMQDFNQATYAIVTHAPPGAPGHHHVNCRDASYWISVFNNYGFRYDPDVTAALKAVSTMTKGFLARNGLFFRKDEE